MASEKQINANRRNAQNSTGPRSAEGRATSSQNALRHGLTAERMIVSGESEEEFMSFYWERYQVLNPTDSIAEGLVERIITCEWRLRRMYRAEARLMCVGGGAGDVFRGMSNEMMAVSRYETAIDRALQRARHELERHQARCRGEAVAPPIAVTVSGTIDVEHEPRPPQNHPRPADHRQDSTSCPSQICDTRRDKPNPVGHGSPMPSQA